MIVPIFNPIIDLSTLENLFLNKNIIINISSKTKQALYSFLLEYKDSTSTLKSYMKELERLVLWCTISLNIDCLDLSREYIIKYQEFLKNPIPTQLWCGTKTAKILKNGQINPKWRPFYSCLSNSSIKKTFKIIDSFFNYLVQINYLSGNPLAVRRRRNKNNNSSKVIDRYLELDEINLVLTALSLYSSSIGNKSNENNLVKQENFLVSRAKYIIILLFYTGMRISEAALHTMSNFIQRENNWFLGIVGKGQKYREIPVPDELLDSLSDFRRNIGLPYLPEFKETTPLIPKIDLKNHLTTRRIDQILKWAFNLGAKYIENKNPRKASKLTMASAHWLRHSYVTYLLNAGASLKVAQENAGHSDVGTTMLYTHVNQADRHIATRGLSLKPRI